MTTTAAITQVLTGRRMPMRVPDIIEAVLPLRDPDAAGKTPGQQVYSILYTEAKKPGGIVIQTGRGEFKLNPKRKARLRQC